MSAVAEDAVAIFQSGLRDLIAKRFAVSNSRDADPAVRFSNEYFSGVIAFPFFHRTIIYLTKSGGLFSLELTELSLLSFFLCQKWLQFV